jgi:hypothetical protein
VVGPDHCQAAATAAMATSAIVPSWRNYRQQAYVLHSESKLYGICFTLSVASSPAARRTAAPPLLLMLPGWHPFSCARVQPNTPPILFCNILELYGLRIARYTDTTSTQHQLVALKRDETNRMPFSNSFTGLELLCSHEDLQGCCAGTPLHLHMYGHVEGKAASSMASFVQVGT